MPGHSGLPYGFPDDETDIAHVAMQRFVEAETLYLTNSNPHTYTGSLACLISGNGAGQVTFICPELGDGEMHGYLYQLSVSDPVGGSSDAWWCTAWPTVYGGSGVMTFFIDDSMVLRGADIGGAPGDDTLPSMQYQDDDCP
ncbi:hypothetical protein JXA80_03055 [bacterium]|nr:hypothetical protein [candidate division CSSED10-310 bacterium]